MIRQNLMEVVGHECSEKSPEKQSDIINMLMEPHHTDLYIEEPEAHLFPSTQKSFVCQLVSMLNGRRKHTCFIATHSPYIMTSFNNVIMAGETFCESKEKAEKVIERMPKRQTLKYDDVAAFEIKDDIIRSIMDEEFRLISADALDSASQEIEEDFEYMLNL